MEPDPQDVILTLKRYKRELDKTDRRVRLYLQDRKRHPHPGHEELIRDIRRFENRVHHVRDGSARTWLDNVMHSLYFYEKLWQRSFDRAAAAPRAGGTRSGDEVAQATRDLLFDKVYAAAVDKWKAHGVERTLSKEEMAGHIRTAYQEARNRLKKGQKISFVYDHRTHAIQVRLERSPAGEGPAAADRH